MAVKKSGKSSKTAHILNVLSSDLSDMTGEAGAGRSVDGTLGGSSVDFSPIPDEALATAIRESLVEDIRLEEGGIWSEEVSEIREETPSPEEKSSIQEAKGVEPEETVPPPRETTEGDSREEAPTPSEVSEAPTVNQTPPPAPEQEAAGSGQEREFCYVNVMEALVEEKAPKYIKMFGVCSCARCVSDVKALALTNLPPKYAVMEKGHVVPMLTVYEGRYSTALTSQIISACKQVMLEPRH
jgi:hypothetical protein